MTETYYCLSATASNGEFKRRLVSEAELAEYPKPEDHFPPSFSDASCDGEVQITGDTEHLAETYISD